MTLAEDDFYRAIRKERRDARRMGRAFGRACASGDVETMLTIAQCLSEETCCGWEQAFRLLPDAVHPDVQTAFLPVWLEHKSIAMQFENKRDVIKGLRRLLRPYNGLAAMLYRGEGHSRKSRSQYGISWTSDPTTAEKFATDARQCADGGSVILSALAPREAILSYLQEDEDHYGEAEYFVDPLLLPSVRIYRAFAQLSHDEHMKCRRERHAAP